jgi:hypothetical protein
MPKKTKISTTLARKLPAKNSLETPPIPLNSTPGMRNNPFAGFLVVLTVVMMVFTAANTYQYILWTTRFQMMLAQYAGMENNRLTVQALANETLQYSRTNPAVEPLLQQFNILPKSTNVLVPATEQPLPQ